MKKKLFIAIPIVIVVIIGIIIGVVTFNSQWEKDISIAGGDWVANGYLNGAANGGSLLDVAEKGNPYYDYEITNETNHPMSDVTIVFKCEKDHFSYVDKWKYEFEVGYLQPHETKSIKVYHWDMYSETDDSFGSTSHEIVKVTYKQ